MVSLEVYLCVSTEYCTRRLRLYSTRREPVVAVKLYTAAHALWRVTDNFAGRNVTMTNFHTLHVRCETTGLML